MIKQGLIEGFRKSVSTKKNNDGIRVFNNDLVSDLSYENDNEKFQLITSVISEDLFSQYSCKIDIEKRSREVIFTNCTCNDFEKNSIKKQNYCCKHLVASYYKFLNLLDENPSIKDELGLNKEKEENINNTESSLLTYLINRDNKKESIRFEIIINKISWNSNIGIELKIGSSNKLYTLKDINGFLLAMYNKIPITYGKDFTFDITKQKLSLKDKKLINFIKLIQEMDYSTNNFRKINEKLISGKQIVIPKMLLKEFFKVIKDYRLFLGNGFYSRLIETEIIEDKLPLQLSLKKVGEMLKLEAPHGIPELLSDNEEVFLYNTNIYLPPEDQIEMIKPYLDVLKHSSSIFFSKKEEERILKELIPSMQKVTTDILLSSSLKDKIVLAPVKFKFYFDKEDEIKLIIKVCYGSYEFNIFSDFNEKVIYRDKYKEEFILQKFKEYGFSKIDDSYNLYLLLPEDDIFYFFKYEVVELHKYGEVFYSDRFTGVQNIDPKKIIGQISKGKYDYLEMKFKIGNISENESTNILRAFKDNKKYYKLKSGDYLDLEQIELNKFLKLIDSLQNEDEILNNTISIDKNKAYYVEEYINSRGIKNIKGRSELKTLQKALTNLKSTNFNLPDDLNANLRPYQKYGYTWLKNLDYLGFGGILGDEMGLGKTLQTIAFLNSNKDANSLIVAPTSLIYNWFNEFRKFAPNMKVKLVYGDKNDRHNTINNYKEYNVLITSYNLIQRDIELYENINFNYCIIDEAQYIKNYNSKNSLAVKKIKANNRFALSGTPIENSLMELWSIFDFIMPNYLYDEKKFNTRYNRRCAEDDVIIEELNMLIKPFILRRYKKEVIKELPEKIEKKLSIPMTDEQKKVYETYSEHVKGIIEKTITNPEFKTNKIEILVYLTKLRQLALDPELVMDEYSGGSGKFDALIEILQNSIEENHKILVFSQFTAVLKKISNILDKEYISYKYLDGSTPSKDRIKLVDEFNNDNTSVFLISLKAGGTGLNLTSADVVIHFDPWWNPAVEDQATDRAHRIGQKNVVEVIKMVSDGTLEDKILLLQEEKRSLINKVIGEDNNLGEFISSLSEEDILSLFSKK